MAFYIVNQSTVLLFLNGKSIFRSIETTLFPQACLARLLAWGLYCLKFDINKKTFPRLTGQFMS